MSELSNTVTDQPRAVPATGWRSDIATVALRLAVVLCAVGGVTATIRGIHAAWLTGAPHDGRWANIVQQAWGVTPFILLVCFFNQRRRLLHDILLGTIIINSPERAQSLRPLRPAG